MMHDRYVMRNFIAKNKKWFGYILFCIIIAGGLLYYRFPSDALRDYLQKTANNVNNSVTLSIDQVKPLLPFGIKLVHSELFLKGKLSRKLFRSDILTIKSSPWSFFKEISKYCFKCLSYGGDITGCVYFKSSMKAPFDTEIELRDIHIAEHEHLKDFIGREIDGILSATIFYKGEHKNLIGGTGEAHVTLAEGKIALLVPVLSIESIEFDEIKSNMALKKQTINLKHVELKGPLLKSTLSGTIRLKKEFTKSALNLKGTIEPYASFFKDMKDISNTMSFFKQRMKEGVLPFIIYGTIEEPKVRLT